jgi:methyltransferase-like protein
MKWGSLRPLNADIVSASFLGMLSGICIKQLRFDGKHSREEIINTLFEIISRGILKSE